MQVGCVRCSSHELLKITMSPMYAVEESDTGCNTCLWKVAATPCNPKGIFVKWYSPEGGVLTTRPGCVIIFVQDDPISAGSFEPGLSPTA